MFRAAIFLIGLTLLPGCVVVSVPPFSDGTPAEAGAAIGALLGATLGAALSPLPPPGVIWDPYAGVWRLP